MSNAVRSDWQHWPLWRPSGFRISWIDALVVAGSAMICAGYWQLMNGRLILLAMAVGHFFLFCNVFRIQRRLELIWAGSFLGTAAIWVFLTTWPWWAMLLLQAPISIAVIAIDLRSPSYHGIWADRINPGFRGVAGH